MSERRSTRIHDSYAYTVERLRGDVPRCLMDPDKARARLVELRDLFDTLLTTKSDAVRARVVNKLRRRLVLGYSNMESVAVWSVIATRTPEEQKAVETKRREEIERWRNPPGV
jgi:hypothetical protein